MPTHSIPFEKTGYFSKLICDYINHPENLDVFYRGLPNQETLIEHALERQTQFPDTHRDVLVKVLEEQYKSIKTSEETIVNIQALSSAKTVTVTTGHQLNLFTGPLYFLYKIISTINLAEELSKKDDNLHVVPIYWMATEDHDFEEINYFNLNGKKFKWSPERYRDNDNGAVGYFSTEGLEDILKLLKAELGPSHNAETLVSLFEKGYLEHDNLADATRYIANELFKDYGLVIIDAAHKDLKRLFVPAILDELKNQTSSTVVQHTTEKLEEKGYNVQVTPREINLFYLKGDMRERIVYVDGKYAVNDKNITWNNLAQLEVEVEEYPERFSPNVIMRPLYQELILPNICYIGGGGELAYWLELKDYFDKVNVPFPILLLRNSVLLMTAKQSKKLEKLNIGIEETFLKQHELINRKVRQISNIDIDFGKQREFLKAHFQDMHAIAQKTDASFLGAVKAQEVKQLKGLDHLEQRLLKAQRLKLKDEVERITKLQNELFPNNSLQERSVNFSEFYVQYGQDLIARLKAELNPLHQEFMVLTL